MSSIRPAIGRVFSKGCGLFGALGHKTLLDKSAFTLVDTGIRASSVATGWAHSAVVTETNDLLVFGRPFELNTLLRLNFIHRFSPSLGRMISNSSQLFGADTSGLYTSPMQVDLRNVKSVACSAGLTAVVTLDGAVYCFGVNKFGQCGLPKETQHVYQPTRVNIPSCLAVDTGFQNCIALTKYGHVFAWGKGKRGQLGVDPILEFSHMPVKVHELEDVVAVSAGFNHSAALTGGGAVFVWGKHMSVTRKVAASVDVYEDQITPRRVDMPSGLMPVEISCSNFALVIRCSDGSLWAVGLGERDRNCNPLPMPVLSDLNENVGTPLAEQDIRVVCSERTKLRKGYTRVAILDPDRDVPLEVIIHNREAYAREVEGTEELARSLETGGEGARAMWGDLASGWKHSLAVVV